MQRAEVVLPEQQYLSSCPACAEQIDVTGLEPFAKLNCPLCRQSVRVRRKFDHFLIIRQIGEGGMSRVFEAEDETLGRRVALKILNRKYSGDLVRMAQFQQEALITARVTHPNVIKLFSVGFDQGHFFIAMELVSGGSLEQRIKREGQVNEKDVLRIGRQVGEGLRAAHRMGLLHRDVKPANILFTEDGTAKVVDFGLALFVQQSDQSGEIWATPFYVSPEKVIDNTEDFRSDLFSLGATLYHALTGNPPHKVKSASLQELRMVKCKRVSLEDTGTPFGTRTVFIVDKLVAFDPNDRPATYDDAVEELRLAEGLIDRPFISLASRRRKIAAAAVIGLGLAFVGGWLLQTVTDEGAKDAKTDEAVKQSLTGGEITLNAGVTTKADRFLHARQALAQGDWKAANAEFESLLHEGVRQPTMNWVRFNSALCALNRKDEALAKTLFHQLASEPGSTNTEGDFFKRVGQRQQEQLGLNLKSSAVKCNGATVDVLGYLSHGIAQWYCGEPAEGYASIMTFLEAIKSGHPVPWIVDYRKIAELIARDAQLAQPFQPVDSKAPIKDIAAAKSSLQAVRSQLNTNGVLTAQIDARLVELDRIAERKSRSLGISSRLRAELERRQRELDQLSELNDALPALVHGYDFSPAIDILKEMQFESKEVRAALEGRLYLYESADHFLDQLIQDCRDTGWTGTVQRKDGSPVTGTVRQLSVKEVHVQLERGEIILPLASISAETLLDMAKTLEQGITDSTDYYRREELMATFAKITGLEDRSAAIATQLMEENRAFRARWIKVLQGGL